jgi:hypothetical protein
MMRWTKLYLTCMCFFKLTHYCFKYSPFICSSWIDRVDFFFIFWPNKIQVSPTNVVSSLFLPDVASPPTDVAKSSHASFLWSQNKLVASASSSSNASSRRVPSRAKTKALNSYHRHRPPSSDHSTSNFHCYKKSSQSWPLFPPLNRASILPPP